MANGEVPTRPSADAWATLPVPGEGSGTDSAT